MKHYLLSAAMLALTCSAAQAQNPMNFSGAQKNISAQTRSKPEEKGALFTFVEEENTHNFGTIPEGPKVTHDFTFTNTGSAPLIITNAQASCGCTSPVFPKEPILPGKQGKISVTYTTENHPGNFSKSVYLTSNAQNTSGGSGFELIIKGFVKAIEK